MTSRQPTPLAILLAAMHRKWAEGDQDGAVALARLAAPYLHPRAPATRAQAELPDLPDAELDLLCRAGGTGAADARPEQPG